MMSATASLSPTELGQRVSPRPTVFHVDTETSVQWVDEDGICHSVFHDWVDETLETAKTNVEAMRAVSGGFSVPTLVDLRRVRSVSLEARSYYASEQTAEVCSAAALLIGSGVSRVLGNLFLALNRPAMPTRLFTDKAEALGWLREMRS